MGVNKVVFGAVSIVDISDSTVTEDKLAKGYTAYDKAGDKITGTMEATAEPTLQEKTVTPKTSAQAVTPDSGYDGLSKVTVNAMQTATQATPSISVSSSGLITASATQSAGYVSAGTKSATKQLTTQAAKTVTPSTANQTAVASGRYTTGAVTVKGDANLVAGNIKSGTSIFGVTGTYSGGTPNLQSKSVTYTSNGTVTITPDSGYDGLSSVDVTVNVEGSGSGGSGGGTIEGFQYENISTGGNFTNVTFIGCYFGGCEFYFYNSANLSFNDCYFENSYISCTQEVHDAIVNGSGNEIHTVSFDITS